MYLIPIGLFFVFYSYDLTIGSVAFDLLPDLVGYVLIAAGLFKLKNKSYSLSTGFPLSIVLAVYAPVIRLFAPTGLAGLAFSAGELGLQLWLLKLLVDGVEDLETSVDAHLNSDVLHRWQQLVSMAWVAAFVCLLAQDFIPGVEFFGFLVAVVFMVLAALLLLTFFRTARRYRWLVRAGGGRALAESQAVEDGGGEEDEEDA